MNGVSNTEIKKFIEANGSEDIEFILAGREEGSFRNIFGTDAGSTLTSYPSVKDKLASGLAKEIKSWSNVRRWTRMGPINPRCYQSIDQKLCQ